MKIALLDKLETIRPFTENEAWWLFRSAALAEAIGWTVLIVGVAIHHFGWTGKNIAVPIAGQIHGTIFLLYFGILIATYSSLRWSRAKFLVAIVAGIPPYGTLLFEQWAARHRSNTISRSHLSAVTLAHISSNLSVTK